MATYGKKSSEKVGKVLHELKTGELKSGTSGKTVTSRKQAIAIGLSEARKEGGKVPPPAKTATKKAASKKAPAKKTAVKKAAAKKAPVKKATAKKAPAKKAATKKVAAKKAASAR